MEVYRARWVLPVTSPPVREGAVAVEEGRIAWVGPARDAPVGESRDLGDALLLPGLVNAHTHLELTALRGTVPDLPFAQWIATLQRAKTSVMTPPLYHDAALLGIAEGLLAGITTYADTCDSGVAIDAMVQMGVRGIMYQEVFGPHPDDCDQSVRELRAKLAAHAPKATPLVRLGVSPHAPYTVSDALFEAIRDLTSDEGLPVAVHTAESAEEDAFVVEGSGPFAEAHRRRNIPVAARAESPVALLERAGLLRADTLLIHAVRTREADVARIARHRCAIAHCPASNARLGHGVAPLLEWIAAGIPVGLGSDSMASNDRMHLLEEARLAYFAQRGRALRHTQITATQVLELATIGAARSLHLGERVGSLEAGKDADLAAFPLDVPSATPHADPIAAAVFALGNARARFVAVQGKPRVIDGRLLVDMAEVQARVRDTGDRLRASLSA